MINKQGILNYIKKQGKTCSIDQIEKIIDSINREEIEKSEATRFKYEIWDKKTHINGVSAKDVIKSRNYTIGQAYIIYIDNIIVYFQDHNPNKEGFIKMTKSEATKIAEEFIQKKIEENVDSIIVSKILKDIM